MSQIVVGVDGGGSKTHVIVATTKGKELASLVGDASAVRPGEALTSAETIGMLVREALTAAEVADRPAILVAGVAGTGREKERKALLRALQGEGLADEVQVTTDAEIALADAFGPASAGILLIAGTGSVAYGADQPGSCGVAVVGDRTVVMKAAARGSAGAH